MTVDCILWIEHVDTNVDGGRRNDASTLEACQAACVSNSQCTGIDWNSSAAENQRCWLSGPWSGQRNNATTTDVSHYDLNRRCGARGNHRWSFFNWNI